MIHEVLAIRHVHFEDLGSLELVLGERGRPVRYLDVGLGRIEAPDPVAPSLMVVLGGPISAGDDVRYPTLLPLLSMIEKRIAAGLPTLGICLGAQLIARALGARVFAFADVCARVSAGRRYVHALSESGSESASDHDVLDRRLADCRTLAGLSLARAGGRTSRVTGTTRVIASNEWGAQ